MKKHERKMYKKAFELAVETLVEKTGCLNCELKDDCAISSNEECAKRWRKHLLEKAGYTEIKPCPFCGDKAEFCSSPLGIHWVRCTNQECEASTSAKTNADEAIGIWNRRA